MIIRLMGTILKEFEDEARQILSSMNLAGISDQDYGYFRYLMVLKSHPNINQNDLAKFVDVNKASVSKAVKYLLKHELIDRVKDEHDSRMKMLHLTDIGDELCIRFKNVLQEVETQLMDGFSSEEVMAFNEMLRKACKNIGTDKYELLLSTLD